VGAALLGAGCKLVDGCDDPDVDVDGSVVGLLGHISKTSGTAIAADAAATSIAIDARLVRYHGSGGALNVNELLLEARSSPFTVQVLTVGEAKLRVGGEGVRTT
jgi:hypothetical protein